MTTYRITVPALFWDDHCDRCPCDGDPELAMAREIKRDKCYPSRKVIIEGTIQQIEVLRSDAAFYCDRNGPDECPPGIKRSAKATLAAIAKVLP